MRRSKGTRAVNQSGYDTVVAASGSNTLAAAIVLARASRRVLAREAGDVGGGG
jgi:phytoene dehydrogenase-like protein